MCRDTSALRLRARLILGLEALQVLLAEDEVILDLAIRHLKVIFLGQKLMFRQPSVEQHAQLGVVVLAFDLGGYVPRPQRADLDLIVGAQPLGQLHPRFPDVFGHAGEPQLLKVVPLPRLVVEL